MAPELKPRRIARMLMLLLLIAGIAGVSVGLIHRFERHSERRNALTLARTGPADAALVSLQRCLDREPDDVELLQATVQLRRQIGSPPGEVEPLAKRWCERQRDSLEAWRTLYDLTQNLNRSATEHIAILEQIVRLEPNDPARRLELGNFYHVVGRYDDAAREFQVLLDTSPIPPQKLWLQLARAKFARGNFIEAGADVHRALALDANDSGTLLLLGIIHQRLGEDRQAIEVLRRVSPQNITEQIAVLNHLGLSYQRTQQANEAKRAFDQMSALQYATHSMADAMQHPSEPGFLVRAAEAMMKAGLNADAIEFIQTSLDRIPPERKLLLLLAECHDRLGRPEDARKARSQADRLP